MTAKKKRKNKRRQPSDPRTSAIVSKAGPVKITRADGTVEFQKPMKPTKDSSKPFAPVRARKAF